MTFKRLWKKLLQLKPQLLDPNAKISLTGQELRELLKKAYEDKTPTRRQISTEFDKVFASMDRFFKKMNRMF